jgi:hypothetical protein
MELQVSMEDEGGKGELWPCGCSALGGERMKRKRMHVLVERERGGTSMERELGS